jgi:hypothetical protein
MTPRQQGEKKLFNGAEPSSNFVERAFIAASVSLY